jgi:hypothetical protein
MESEPPKVLKQLNTYNHSIGENISKEPKAAKRQGLCKIFKDIDGK